MWRSDTKFWTGTGRAGPAAKSHAAHGDPEHTPGAPQTHRQEKPVPESAAYGGWRGQYRTQWPQRLPSSGEQQQPGKVGKMLFLLSHAFPSPYFPDWVPPALLCPRLCPRLSGGEKEDTLLGRNGPVVEAAFTFSPVFCKKKKNPVIIHRHNTEFVSVKLVWSE